jgi:hypothetical protein
LDCFWLTAQKQDKEKRMHHKRFWFAPLAVLVMFVLLASGAAWTYRSGWTQGYLVGRLAAVGEEGAALPYGLHGLGIHGGTLGRGSLFCAPAMLLLGGLLFLGVLGKAFRWRHWRRAMAECPEAADAFATWHHFHGNMPPWCRTEKHQAQHPESPPGDAGDEAAPAA